MRILQISANWGHGGPGGIMKDLHCEFQKAGHNCCVAVGRGSVPDGVDCIRIGTKLGVYFHAFLSRLFDRSGFYSRLATKRFIKKVKEFNPDVIILHNLLGYYINISILYGFLSSFEKPVILVAHDCWPITGHCINFEFLNCNGWEDGCKSCKYKKTYPKCYGFSRASKNYKEKKTITSSLNNFCIITPSLWLFKIIKNTFLSKYPIKVINNGINLNNFKPTKSDIRKEYLLEEKTLILFVASTWDNMKGQQVVNDLSSIIDNRFQIVMIGKKDSFKPHNNIISINRLDSQTDLAKWYSAADVFANPTFGDNFPTVDIEALACGTPVATFDTGGSAEIVGDCGVIAKTKDAVGLLNAIITVIEKRVSVNDCCQRAFRFRKEKHASEILSLIDKMKDNNENNL